MKINEIVSRNFSAIFEENLLHELYNYGILKKADPDQIILEIRRKIEFVPIIISGVAKVMRRDGKGNGFFLHYLTDNQISATAISYSLEAKKSEVRLKAESKVTYIAIPSKVVNSWFEKYNTWRSFYIKYNQIQTSYLLTRINDLAFESLEIRLLKYLEESCFVYNDTLINKKHFDIARDLKVSREAISRVLKKLENEDVISLGRNKIILN